MTLELLDSISHKLNGLEIPYMVSGSLAMTFYSVSRNTRDVDIIIHLQEEDLDRFLAAFPNYYLHRPSIEVEVKRKGMFNLIDTESGYKIDFILLRFTRYGKTAFERKELKTLYTGSKVWVISIEDLIIAKLVWIQQLQSDRQIQDIQQLMQSTTLDLEYLKHWISELDLHTFNLI